MAIISMKQNREYIRLCQGIREYNASRLYSSLGIGISTNHCAFLGQLAQWHKPKQPLVTGDNVRVYHAKLLWSVDIEKSILLSSSDLVSFALGDLSFLLIKEIIY